MPRGRISIFGSKASGKNVHGIISKIGKIAFGRAEKRLKALYIDIVGKKPTSISDADVVEYLARGDFETRTALEALRKKLEKKLAA